MNKLDFLAVGDITIDSYIRLRDVSVHCELNREQCQLCMNFGEKVPFESVDDIPAVGNAPNAAVAASRLGLKSAVATDIGNDTNGKICIEQLKKEGVNTQWITTHNEMSTNHNFVLWFEDERTILVHHAPYPYSLPKLPESTWVYLSSIGENSEEYHKSIEKYLEEQKETKLTFQPGTFQIRMGQEKLAPFLKRAELLAVNASEARRIIGANLTLTDLLQELSKFGPKIVLITDGRNGAYLFDGTDKWHMPIYPDIKPPLERTGAGDATTSTLSVYLSRGLSPIEALRYGHINARSVVQQIGAQRGLMTQEQIDEALAKAPVEFVAEKIS